MEKKSPSHLKVAVIGPESCGKSVLCEELAVHYKTVFVPEYARTHLTLTGGQYRFEDLLFFAQKQKELEQELSQKANGILFCDTDLHNILVWSTYEFGRCDPQLEEAENNQDYHFYLLLFPDLPWVKDPLRNNAPLRQELYLAYQERLQKKERPYGVVSGTGKARLECAREHLEKFLIF